MARYKVAHFPGRTWICKSPDGTFFWGSEDDSKGAYLFPNYKAAWAALESLPDKKLMYNESYRKKCHFMKFYDSDEHFEREQEYLQNKRQLRDWGH